MEAGGGAPIDVVPLGPAIWFSLLGINWWVFIALGLFHFRPRPFVTTDYVMASVGVALGLFYFWVGAAVYRRRRYILDCAFVCGGFGLLSFPFGTLISILLISSLIARKHDFTR